MDNALFMNRSLPFLLIFAALLLAACNLSTTMPTPAPTPDLPIVEILSAPNNAPVLEATVFDFDIVARDETQGVERIELRIDEQIVAEARPVDQAVVPVFRVTMNWRAQGVGRHIVEAIAYRSDGTRSDAAVLNIEVLPR